jgi:hypothetical protein
MRRNEQMGGERRCMLAAHRGAISRLHPAALVVASQRGSPLFSHAAIAFRIAFPKDCIQNSCRDCWAQKRHQLQMLAAFGINGHLCRSIGREKNALSTAVRRSQFIFHNTCCISIRTARSNVCQCSLTCFSTKIFFNHSSRYTYTHTHTNYRRFLLGDLL